MYLTHFAVHTPLQGKKSLVNKYNDKPAGKLHQSAVMAAMIQSVDEGIGRISEKLDELGLADKTAIVFTSDNGGYGPATSMHPLKGYKGADSRPPRGTRNSWPSNTMIVCTPMIPA